MIFTASLTLLLLGTFVILFFIGQKTQEILRGGTYYIVELHEEYSPQQLDTLYTIFRSKNYILESTIEFISKSEGYGTMTGIYPELISIDMAAFFHDVIYNGFNIGDLEGFSIKALGGLQIATSNIDTGFGSTKDTEMGLNVGVHATIPINDELDLYIEPKFVISAIDGFVISAGVFF